MNAITKTEGLGLEVLDTEVVLDGDLAWNVAQLISDAESDVRLAKGKFWNRCKYGTREEICESFEWKTDTVKKYAMYARETELCPVGHILFAHWKTLYDGKIGSEYRPEWLQKAVDNEWTPKQLTEVLKERHNQIIDRLNKEDLERDIKNKEVPDDTTIEDYDERKQKSYDDFINKERRIPHKTATAMTLAEACEFFGLSPVTWMTEDTLDILYKGYSKMLHPDVAKDDGVAMQTLNRAKDIIKKIVR